MVGGFFIYPLTLLLPHLSVGRALAARRTWLEVVEGRDKESGASGEAILELGMR
jgi:hypothetical protein